MPKSCVLGCPSDVTMFRFPDDEPRRQHWFKVINMEYTITGKFLCGRHFSTRQYSKKLLKQQAVPDINLEPTKGSIVPEGDTTNNIDILETITVSADDKLKKSSTKFTMQNDCSILLLTNKQLKSYVGPDNRVKYIKEGNTVRLLKNASKSAALKHKKMQTKAPKATLEMMLTAKEFKKMEALPKLPTIKNKVPNALTQPATIEALPKLPTNTNNCPTATFMTTSLKVEGNQESMPCSADWKTQAEILRRKVEERLKDQKESFGLQKHTQKVNLEMELKKLSTPLHKLPTQKSLNSTIKPVTNATLSTPNVSIDCSLKTEISCNNTAVSQTLQPGLTSQPATIAVKISKPMLCLDGYNVIVNNSNLTSIETAVQKSLQPQEHTQEKFEDFVKKCKTESAACLNQLTHSTVASQTGSDEFETCGLIQRSDELDRYFLTCFYCTREFEITDWDQFTFHNENSHKFDMKRKVEKNRKDKNRILMPQSDNSLEKNDVQNKTDEANVIVKQDFATITTEATYSVDVQSGAVINFYESESKKILNFLKKLQMHAILWHPRRYGPKIIDIVMQKFLSAFDDNSLTLHDLNCSLENARKFQQRFNALTGTKKLQLQNEPHLQVYVDQLNEIVAHAKIFIFECELCSNYYLDQNLLYKHKFLKHQLGDVTHICSCGEYFANIGDKSLHESTHHVQPQHKCTHCELRFFSDKKLRQHIAVVHSNAFTDLRLYQCTKCSEHFPTNKMLEWHRIKHEAPRYACGTCGKKYHKAYQYQNHLKKHLDQRDYMCEECGKAYLTNLELKKHRQLVHKIGEHYCEHCKIFFVSFENLYMHKQRIHPNGSNLDHRKRMHAANIKRYYHRLKAARPEGPGRKKPELKCKQCGAIFLRMRELRQHKRDYGHTLGDEPYKCPHCLSILNSKLCFLQHLRKMHQLSVKYSDIKYYCPLMYAAESNDGIKIENVSLIQNVEDAHFNNVIAYEEVDEAVQNLNVEDCDMVNVEYFEEFPKIEP